MTGETAGVRAAAAGRRVLRVIGGALIAADFAGALVMIAVDIEHTLAPRSESAYEEPT